MIDVSIEFHHRRNIFPVPNALGSQGAARLQAIYRIHLLRKISITLLLTGALLGLAAGPTSFREFAFDQQDRRLAYRLRNARLRHADASIEDVDYRNPRRLDKALFQQLARGQWIAGKQNLIITGPCGVGKSWLACALGQKACRDDRSVLYKRLPRMFAELETGRADGRYPRLFRVLTRANLLILDDWGPERLPERLNAGQRRDLMEIVEDRHQNAAILITSQLPLAKWHEIIGEPTFADAILDRIGAMPTDSSLTDPQGAKPWPRKMVSQPLTNRKENDNKRSPNGVDHTAQIEPR